MSDHVAAVNALTGAWLARADRPGVLSGAGVWPLLAVLAASADEPGRSELASAVGMPADDAMAAARLVLDTMVAADGVDAALGIWAQRAAQVREDWRARLPPSAYGELTGDAAVDQPRLDNWAREHTHGLIERMPVTSGPDLMMTLATALALRTTWERKFSDAPLRPVSGPWGGRELAGLRRTTADLDEVVVADETPVGTLTVTRVSGDNGLDVHLVLSAADRAPNDVLPAAIEVIEGRRGARAGSELLDSGASRLGPGLTAVSATRRGLALETVRFTVRAEHDLLDHAEVFGLREVTRSDRGHFSEVSDVALRVDQARQSAVAIFSAVGFEAAAVTSIGVSVVSMPRLNARGLAVSYDRPFGFVATHRATGLVLFAGWVDQPATWDPGASGRR